MEDINQMIDLENMLLDIRRTIPRRDRSMISNYQEMFEYLKYVDLPDNLEIILRSMWDVFKNNAKEIHRCLSNPDQSIETYHELVVGYSLYEHCKNNSLLLQYSPTLDVKTPDWIVKDRIQKIIIEVVTSNKSNSHCAFDTCLGLIQILIKRGLKRIGITETLDFNTSRFKVPKEDSKDKNEKYTKFCNEVADRIVAGLKCGLGNNEWFYDESGLEAQIGYGISSRMTTSGYETYREITRILDKGKKYQELSKEHPLIVAVANSNWIRSNSYRPTDIAQLIYCPNSVYDLKYDRIDDKERHINEINQRREDLESIEGILFYNINYRQADSTNYEYYSNPLKRSIFSIPYVFSSYLVEKVNDNTTR
jgi:hypothetical protein